MLFYCVQTTDSIHGNYPGSRYLDFQEAVAAARKEHERCPKEEGNTRKTEIYLLIDICFFPHDEQFPERVLEDWTFFIRSTTFGELKKQGWKGVGF